MVEATPSLQALQEEFEGLYNDSASGNVNKGLQKEVINAVLKSAADDTNANQSL